MTTTYHLTINGEPYCMCESRIFGMCKRYPTNCAHGSKESAEQAAAACRELRLDVEVAVVEGTCHSDPFWLTERGRKRILEEEEWSTIWD